MSAPRTRLVVQPLGSGSAGNATAIRGPEGTLLIDAGFSARETLRRLAMIGVEPRDLRALIVTHGHGDHARGAAVLARKTGVPVWGTAPTLAGLRNLRGGERLEELPANGERRIARHRVETLAVSHDAPGTVILRIDRRLALATDLGTVTAEVRRFLSGLELLLLELNHDVDLLRGGVYPGGLQERILSSAGHLSNAQAAALLAAADFEPPSRGLYLCHLSQENNRPALAHGAAKAALAGRGVEIRLARQDGPTTPFEL